MIKVEGGKVMIKNQSIFSKSKVVTSFIFSVLTSLKLLHSKQLALIILASSSKCLQQHCQYEIVSFPTLNKKTELLKNGIQRVK
jgi:hypothetical protein